MKLLTLNKRDGCARRISRDSAISHAGEDGRGKKANIHRKTFVIQVTQRYRHLRRRGLAPQVPVPLGEGREPEKVLRHRDAEESPELDIISIGIWNSHQSRWIQSHI